MSKTKQDRSDYIVQSDYMPNTLDNLDICSLVPRGIYLVYVGLCSSGETKKGTSAYAQLYNLSQTNRTESVLYVVMMMWWSPRGAP